MASKMTPCSQQQTHIVNLTLSNPLWMLPLFFLQYRRYCLLSAARATSVDSSYFLLQFWCLLVIFSINSWWKHYINTHKIQSKKDSAVKKTFRFEYTPCICIQCTLKHGTVYCSGPSRSTAVSEYFCRTWKAIRRTSSVLAGRHKMVTPITYSLKSMVPSPFYTGSERQQ